MESRRVSNCVSKTLVPDVTAGEIAPAASGIQLAQTKTAGIFYKRNTKSITRFVAWLAAFGETSFDHQSYFAGPIGGRAKALYYKKRSLGTLAVAPMIFSEAFMPQARKIFWKRQRFPIADAHYAMGFALLAQTTQNEDYYRRATHFLSILEQTRCAQYREYCWGYPFDWVTRTGVMPANTPLVTSTPYAYEAFSQVYKIDGNSRWLEIMSSAAKHLAQDIHDKAFAPNSWSAGYNPFDMEGGVINASAYRAFLLTDAALHFSNSEYMEIAERNLNFVLESQQPNGSWYYSVDGVRDFVDHFHTCFVLKALVKIEALTGDSGCQNAIEKGVSYYVDHLFDEDGLPKPFSRAPRLTVYRQELYDYAECINLAVMLRGRFPALDSLLNTTISDLMDRWQKKDGSFRSRRLLLGWDNVPMHRWAQAQIFRSLCFYHCAIGTSGHAQ